MQLEQLNQLASLSPQLKTRTQDSILEFETRKGNTGEERFEYDVAMPTCNWIYLCATLYVCVKVIVHSNVYINWQQMVECVCVCSRGAVSMCVCARARACAHICMCSILEMYAYFRLNNRVVGV